MEYFDPQIADSLANHDGAEQYTATTIQQAEIPHFEDAWQNMTGGEQITTGILGLAAFAAACALTWFNLNKSP